MKTQTYTDFINANFRTVTAKKLQYKVGDEVVFKTECGNFPGRWTGKITKRLIDSPWGFLSYGWKHFWKTGDDSKIAVRYEVESYTPAMYRVYNKMSFLGEKSLLLTGDMIEGKVENER